MNNFINWNCIVCCWCCSRIVRWFNSRKGNFLNWPSYKPALLSMNTTLNFSVLTSVHSDSTVNLRRFLDNSFCKFNVLHKWELKCLTVDKINWLKTYLTHYFYLNGKMYQALTCYKCVLLSVRINLPLNNSAFKNVTL